MEIITPIIGYHATDFKYAKTIMDTGFICKQSDKHWLGNGFYFFLDKLLAEWWGKNPTNRFGCNITNKVIIKTHLGSDSTTILNLLSLDGYNHARVLWNEFHLKLTSTNKTSCIPNTEVLRCMFFDWIYSEYDCEIVIAAFYKKNAAYIAPKNQYQLPDFPLSYPEIQVCVFSNDSIISTELC